MLKQKPYFLSKNSLRIVLHRILLVCAGVFIFSGLVLRARAAVDEQNNLAPSPIRWWSFQSIDTMKYSRDTARQQLASPKAAEQIDQHIMRIAQTGVTHVAIATPYDEEFLPILTVWVKTARKYGINVWFRGNWSGWEQWFNYPRISRAEHLEKTRQFIASHPELFADDDVFSACPECENGGPGDPRSTGDAAGHKKFLIDEYRMMEEEFNKLGKKVTPGFNSMNGDVARLIMDKETTAALGGYVVVDHYVKSPQKLADDIREYAKRSEGKVILGEFGAPIPDIHGKMTEEEQQRWIENLLTAVIDIPELAGVSYWTDVGSSTALWSDTGKEKKAVQTITSFYRPIPLTGKIENVYDEPVAGVHIKTGQRDVVSAADGTFSVPIRNAIQKITVSGGGYRAQDMNIDGATRSASFRLVPEKEPFFTWLLRLISEKFFD